MKSSYFSIKITILFVILLFLSGCGGGGSIGVEDSRGGNGVLNMKVYSPYETLVSEEEQSYYDGESKSVSKSVVTSRYRDYGEKYSQNSIGFSDEPFCRIGGQYRVEVTNKNVHGNYNKKAPLYYCKTTQDLINRIKIPENWTNSKLTLYCNDGNLINFQEYNLDFLTTKFNNYKVCILKNELLENKNTIVYGFEIGNKEIDSNSKYNFNPSSPNFGFDTETVNSDSTVGGLTKEVEEYVSVPYENWCNSCSESGDSYQGYRESATANCAVRPAPGSGSTCWSVETESFPAEVTDPGGTTCVSSRKGEPCVNQNNPRTYRNIWGKDSSTGTGYKCVSSACDHVKPKVTSSFSNSDYSTLHKLSDRSFTDSRGELVSVSINGQGMYGVSWYGVKNLVPYSVSTYSFNADSRTFYFGYDESDTYYSIKEIQEPLSVPITSVFSIPSEFDLSRVALFRSLGGNKKVYGYETPAKMKISGEDSSTKAVYTILLSSSLGFSQNDCINTLATYGAKAGSFLSSSDSIVCGGNNKILLNRMGLDSITKEGTTFTLFKNIILDLK